jgi:hypothetical protein
LFSFKFSLTGHERFLLGWIGCKILLHFDADRPRRKIITL